MKRTIYCSLAVMLLFVFVMGCSKETPNEPETSLDPIDQEFGGYSTSQEVIDDLKHQWIRGKNKPKPRQKAKPKTEPKPSSAQATG